MLFIPVGYVEFLAEFFGIAHHLVQGLPGFVVVGRGYDKLFDFLKLENPRYGHYPVIVCWFFHGEFNDFKRKDNLLLCFVCKSLVSVLWSMTQLRAEEGKPKEKLVAIPGEP